MFWFGCVVDCEGGFWQGEYYDWEEVSYVRIGLGICVGCIIEEVGDVIVQSFVGGVGVIVELELWQ